MSSNNNNIIGGGSKKKNPQNPQRLQRPQRQPFKKQEPPKLKLKEVPLESLEFHYTIEFLGIKITPTKVVKIPATHHSLERKLIEYTIKKYSDDPEHNIKIKRVPYYFSDGETNGLKSFLRFPMLYFTTGNKMGETTSRLNFSGNGGVIKNGLVKNLSVSYATKETRESAIDKYKGYIDKINRQLQREQHISYIDSIHDNINGLSSMFSRVGNILDLLILICDDKLISFNSDLSIFIDGGTFRNYRPRIDLPMPVFLDDFWRFMILHRLKATYNFFITNGLKLTKVHVPVVNETFQSYNDSLNMFKNDEQTINEETKIKYNRYINISVSLQRRLQKNMLEIYGNNEKFVGFKILPPPPPPPYTDIVEFLQRAWEMNVKKKYLKYKIKYLLLEDIKKKLLLNNP